MSVKEAREKAIENKKLLNDGVDINKAKKKYTKEAKLQELFNNYLISKKKELNPNTYKEYERYDRPFF